MTDHLRFPIGRFAAPPAFDAATRAEAIATLASLPAALRTAVGAMTDAQLDTPYRPEGWTVRQVVHHLADSHAHAFIRTRWALTEENPRIKPYLEGAWASLPDAAHGPVEPSLQMLEGLHARWVALLETLDEDGFRRPWLHPDREGTLTVDFLVALYAWHSRHHLAHIALVG